jgi:methionine-S-sulfoxide reductase
MTNLLLGPLLLALSAGSGEATAVFAGGCFWGTEYVFEHVKGVHYVMSGFARDKATGTPADLPQPVEAVRIDYDPAVVSYKQLLEVFFLVAHDPTSWDRQGPDAGPEYRAVVFALYPGDAGTAKEYLATLAKSKKFSKPIRHPAPEPGPLHPRRGVPPGLQRPAPDRRVRGAERHPQVGPPEEGLPGALHGSARAVRPLPALFRSDRGRPAVLR